MACCATCECVLTRSRFMYFVRSVLPLEQFHCLAKVFLFSCFTCFSCCVVTRGAEMRNTLNLNYVCLVVVCSVYIRLLLQKRPM